MIKIKKLISVLLVAFLVISIVPVSFITNSHATSLEEMEQQMKDKEAAIKNKEEAIKNAEARKKKLESLKVDTQAYLKQLETSINNIYNNIAEINKKIEDKEAQIVKKEEEITLATNDIASQYDAMKKRIQYMYENGNVEYVNMVLASENLSEMLNKAEYISKITEYDRKMLKKLEDAKKELEVAKATLVSEKEAIVGLKEAAEVEAFEVNKLKSLKSSEVNQYEEDITDAQKLMEMYERELQTELEQKKEIEELIRKRKQSQVNLTYDGGQLMWPVPGYSRVTDKFGIRKDPMGGAGTVFHHGIDVGRKPDGTSIDGASIYAAYDGQVVQANWSNSVGNRLWIEHGEGFFTIYLHLKSFTVKEGDYVKKGDLVGYVGNTGYYTTGSHLHFGVFVAGDYVDPLKYVIPE